MRAGRSKGPSAFCDASFFSYDNVWVEVTSWRLYSMPVVPPSQPTMPLVQSPGSVSLWLPMTTVGESPASSGSLMCDSVFLAACQWIHLAGKMCNMYWDSVGPQGGRTLRTKETWNWGKEGSLCKDIFAVDHILMVKASGLSPGGGREEGRERRRKDGKKEGCITNLKKCTAQ